MFMFTVMVLKTTVDLRNDVYYYITTKFGKRMLSKKINELLVRDLIAENKKKSMFGSDKWLQKVDLSDLRDESDHDL